MIQGQSYNPNEFRGDLPDSIRKVSPDLYVFLRDTLLGLRQFNTDALHGALRIPDSELITRYIDAVHPINSKAAIRLSTGQTAFAEFLQLPDDPNPDNAGRLVFRRVEREQALTGAPSDFIGIDYTRRGAGRYAWVVYGGYAPIPTTLYDGPAKAIIGVEGVRFSETALLKHGTVDSGFMFLTPAFGIIEDAGIDDQLVDLLNRLTATEATILDLRQDVTAIADSVSEFQTRTLLAISRLESRTPDEQLSQIYAELGSRIASQRTELSALATESELQATALSRIYTSTGELSASVNTLAESVGGISARYAVVLDVNGSLTGFELVGGGGLSEFNIQAENFRIFTNAGAKTPFAVSADRVELGVDLHVQNHRIIFDNGVTMRVQGTGFGASNQFLDWAGPSGDPSLVTEATAIQYLTVDGDAYFGGTLSAGLLRNAAETSATAATANVTIGPFGTNGNPIQVVGSYSVQSGATTAYAADSAGESAWEAAVTAWGATATGTPGNRTVNASKVITCNVVVRIERLVSGVNNTTWATLTITAGTETLVGDGPVAGDSTGSLTTLRTVAGSVTATDNVGGTADRRFLARLTTRTSATIGTIASQRVGVIATEES